MVKKRVKKRSFLGRGSQIGSNREVSGVGNLVLLPDRGLKKGPKRVKKGSKNRSKKGSKKRSFLGSKKEWFGRISALTRSKKEVKNGHFLVFRTPYPSEKGPFWHGAGQLSLPGRLCLLNIEIPFFIDFRKPEKTSFLTILSIWIIIFVILCHYLCYCIVLLLLLCTITCTITITMYYK